LPNPRDNRDIYTMTSTDGGATWSERLKINDDEKEDPDRQPGYDQFIAGISVAPNGRVDLAWYDMRTDAFFNGDGNGTTNRENQTCWDVFTASSVDGGKTFGENVRVSDRTMNQTSGFALNLAYDLRAPIGVASTDDKTFVVWPDSRNGTFNLPTEDTYLATVLRASEDDAAVDTKSLLLGAAAALAVAGLAVLILVAVSRRKKVS
ncbi:MAG: glycoside hydrolase, partial [Actinomycetota bacterium]|nr:glycoside hydrolase [Actinomycetota bacterium]